MKKMIIGGLAAFAIVAVSAAAGLAAPANADTTKCSTDYSLWGTGSETTCNVFTNDGGWSITSTYCDGNGNCTTD
jgi:hypothetical protein